MRQNLHLYIGDMEVEFNQPPDILYTYQTTELTNPTVVKNSFSKQITIYGSPQNNNIFGQYWNVERLQGTSNGIGAYFNPSKKVPFTLYINGDIYESGYVKLDEVKIVEGKSVEYYITLYGGLGQFFYNLSTDWNTGNKRTLADLNYYKWSEDTTPLDLSFTINKETVASAWTAINSNDVYSVINFAPVYAGLPDNIDADKVVMNFNGLSGFSSSVTVDNKTYTTNNGYALATLPQKLMAEEVRDYRSYLQTPIIRVSSIIDAICRKENNSGLYDEGYEVDLDRDFFNTSNPYYYDSWMTLPSLTNLEFSTNGGVPTAWTGTWTSAVTNNNYTYTFPLAEPITEQNTTVTMSFDLAVVVPVMDGTGTVVNNLYMYYTRLKGRGTRVYYRNAYGLQLYASNSLSSNENVLAGSDVKWLTGEQKYDYNDAVASGQYSKKFNNSNVEVLVGNFVNCPNSIQYIFNKRLTFTCDLPVGSTCFKLQLAFTNSSNNSDRFKLSTSTQANTGTLRDIFSVMPFKSVPSDDKTITIQYLDDGDSYSNRYISKEMLLGTDFSPCDFLLSYCKQFGLYIYKDRVEDKIYIKTRKNFYDRTKIEDINDKIDRLNDIAVKPLNIDYGFFALTNSGETSSFYTDYMQKYGKIYGQKIIATGYDFNADTNNLIDSVFKGAVQSKEMSQYFFKPNNKVHPYMFNSVKYALYEQGNYDSGSTDVNAPFKVIAEDFEPYDASYAGYDYISKPMFYDASKKPLGTEYVMLFFNGYQSIPASYNWNLTDDIGAMYKLNNNPCWLLTTSSADTGGNTIAIPITQFPRFSRWYEGNKWMTYSWDFGSPRELYVPDMTNNDEGNIYWNYFKTYYEDAYDVNSKIVEAYVINKEFTQDDLRKFYWFDNAVWVLNKIEDYNVTSFEGTKCTFLKVQDVQNYSNEDATTDLWIKVTLDKLIVPSSGGTIVGTVRTSDNYGWNIENWSVEPYDSAYTITIEPESYGSSGNFFITAGTNSGYDETVTIYVTAGDTSANVSFVHYGKLGDIVIEPENLTFAGSGETKTLSVSNPNGVEWRIVGSPDWITYSPSSGSATSSTITVTAAANLSSDRTGELEIYNPVREQTSVITLNQEFGIDRIEFDNVAWVTDVPYSGGTATSANCSFNIFAYSPMGDIMDISGIATVSGSLVVPVSQIDERHSVGTLTLTATYKGFSATTSVLAYQEEHVRDYLNFDIISGGTISWVNDSVSSSGKTISYSKNNGEWTEINSRDGGATINVSAGDNVRFKGTNSTYNIPNTNYASFSGTTAKFNLSGNILSLVYGDLFETETELIENKTFYGLFNYSGVVSAEDLTLPNNVTYECYLGLFLECTSLTSAPELPATTLAYGCYGSMFWGCSSLTTAPALPATTLAEGCYGGMFKNCTSLTTAPELPVTTLAVDCYMEMFGGCTSLVNAPALPATTLAQGCYQYMFYGCTSLTTSPDLPATMLSPYCYFAMFTNCSSLNHIKCMAVNITPTNCTADWVKNVSPTGTFIKEPSMSGWGTGYNGIPSGWTVQDVGTPTAITFSNLTWIKDVPEYGGIADSGNCSFNVIVTYDEGSTGDVTSVSYISGSEYVGINSASTRSSGGTLTLVAIYGSLSATSSVTIYQSGATPENNYLTMIVRTGGTISVTSLDNTRVSLSFDLGDTWTSYNNASFTKYANDIVLLKGQESTYRTLKLGGTAYFDLYGNIMSLIGGDSFENLKTLSNDYTFNGLFKGSNVVDASQLCLPATALTEECYGGLFSECTYLTKAPKLPATTLGDKCYSYMFSKCRSLTKAPELPATTLTSYCYRNMFQGCSAMTEAQKELPATTLANDCYNNMFSGCTSLTTAPILPAATLANECYYCMFGYCNNLNKIICLATDISATYSTDYWTMDVASAGTFLKASTMSNWTTGTSGIPSGWTVQDYVTGTSIMVGQLSGGTIGVGYNCEANFANGAFMVSGNTIGTISNVGDYIVVNGGQFGWSNITYYEAQEVEFSYNWSGDHHVYTSNCYMTVTVTDGVNSTSGVLMNNHSISTTTIDLTPFWTNDTTVHNLTVTLSAAIN